MSTERNNNEASPSDEARLKRDLERQLRAQLANVTGDWPRTTIQAWWDWYLNRSKEPDKQFALVQSALEKALDTWQFAARAATGGPVTSAR